MSFCHVSALPHWIAVPKFSSCDTRVRVHLSAILAVRWPVGAAGGALRPNWVACSHQLADGRPHMSRYLRTKSTTRPPGEAVQRTSLCVRADACIPDAELPVMDSARLKPFAGPSSSL